MTRVILILMVMLFALPTYAQTMDASTPVEAPITPDASMEQPVITNVLEPTEVQEEIQMEEVEKAGLPQFDTSKFSSQLFWLGLSFAVLYFFFAKKSLPTVSSILEGRQSKIKNDLDQADALSSKVEATKNDYEAAIATARSDASLARQQVETSLREKIDAESNAFNEKSMKAIADLEASAAAEKNRIIADLENVAVELVQDIVTKVTTANIDQGDIAKAVKSELASKEKPSTQKKAA